MRCCHCTWQGFLFVGSQRCRRVGLILRCLVLRCLVRRHLVRGHLVRWGWFGLFVIGLPLPALSLGLVCCIHALALALFSRAGLLPSCLLRYISFIQISPAILALLVLIPVVGVGVQGLRLIVVVDQWIDFLCGHAFV